MRMWENRVISDELVEQVKALGAELEQIIADDEYTLSTLARLNRLKSMLDNFLEKPDAEMVTPTMTASLKDSLGPLISSLVTLRKAPSKANVDETDRYTDGLVNSMRQLPLTEDDNPSRELDGLKRLATEAVGDLEKSLGELRAENAVLKSDLAETELKRATIDQSVGQQLTDLTAAVSSEKARLGDILAQFQSQFSAAQEARLNEFQETKEELRHDVGQHMVTIRMDAESTLEKLKEYLKQAGEVVNAIGIEGMAGAFKTVADDQKRYADRLQFGAIVAFVLTSLAALWAFGASHDPGQTFELSEFLGRLSLSVPVGAAGAYCISQSSRHRHREERARQVEMELEAIDPYLALLPDDDRNEIKKKLALAWFGQTALPVDPKDDAFPANVAAELVKLLDDRK